MPSNRVAPPTLPARYLSPSELAAILVVPVQTIYQWRYLGTGPKGFRVGRHLRYDPAIVRQWIDTCTADETAA